MRTSEILSSVWSSMPDDVRGITLVGYLALLVSSIVMALLIAHLYNRYFDVNTTGSKIHRAFPLLAPAVTTIFVTVQYSLPLSLGLLGALSIVRFRTPIKEPEEIGFILLVIATSLSIATFNLSFAVILYLVVFASLEIRNRLPNGLGLNTVSRCVLTAHITDNNVNDGTKIVDLIQQKIISEKSKASILNCQFSDKATTATFLLSGLKETGSVNLISALRSEFPNVSFDFYQR